MSVPESAGPKVEKRKRYADPRLKRAATRSDKCKQHTGARS